MSLSSRTSRSVACVALAAAAAPLLASRLSAQAREWTLEQGSRQDRFGSAVDSVADLDGDGLRDVAATRLGHRAQTVTGALQLRSSATGALLRETSSAYFGDQFGAAIATLGDLDGDGFDEVAVAAPDREVGGGLRGAVDVVSSASGLVLRSHVTTAGGVTFGGRIARLADVDGDGIGDYACSEGAFQTKVAIVSGATGATIRTHSIANGSGSYGRSLCDAGDVDGDGIHDVAIADPNHVFGAVFLHSGANGLLIRTLANLRTSGAQGAESVAAAGDLDGDGIVDLLIGGYTTTLPIYSGAIVAVAGSDGRTLWYVTEPTPGSGERYGASLVVGGDFDGDGDADLASGSTATSGLYWFDLATGAAVGSVALPAACGAALAAVDDLDGDGSTELIAGMPSVAAAGQIESAGVAELRAGLGGALRLSIGGVAFMPSIGVGRCMLDDRDGDGWRELALGVPGGDGDGRGFIRITSGRTGAELVRFVGGAPLERFAHSLAVVGDHDGDGVDDLQAGVPFAAGGGAVELRSGASGALLATWSAPPNSFFFGGTVAAAADASGRWLAAVADPNYPAGGPPLGRVELFDVATGASLGARVGGSGATGLGIALDFVGDTTGDGAPEWAVGALGPFFGAPGNDALELLSGADASLVWQVVGSPGDEVGASVCPCGDVDGDAIADVRTGNPYAANGAGLVTTRSGVDGARLLAWSAPPAAGQPPGFGSAVAHLGDVDGDGSADFAVGAPWDSASAILGGADHVVSGRTGFPLKRFEGRDDWGFLGSLLLSAPLGDTTDVDGDGVADLGEFETVIDFSGGAVVYRFSLTRLRRALLSLDPPAAAAGETVVAALRGGPSGAAAGLFLVDFGGAPVGQFLALGALDATSTFAVGDTIPPGLAGLDMTLRGYVIGWNGRVVASPDETLRFE